MKEEKLTCLGYYGQNKTCSMFSCSPALRLSSCYFEEKESGGSVEVFILVEEKVLTLVSLDPLVT